MDQDLVILLKLISCGVLVFLLIALIIEFENTVKRVKYIVYDIRKRKQDKCYHAWRRLDAEYYPSYTVYRYKCEKCQADKKLNDWQSERFEKDFMSDWTEE